MMYLGIDISKAKLDWHPARSGDGQAQDQGGQQ